MDSIVERRLRYIERQKKLHADTVNVDPGSRPVMGTGSANRHGMPQLEEFLALPQADDVSDFHCVTTWSRHDNQWKGVRFRTIAELVVPKDEAHFVLCTGYDHMPGTRIPYTTNLPLARAIEEDVLLVHTWEGAPLPREHGGPVRMITPKLYAWKGTKWIRTIEFLARDQRGFWEVRGYSNTAEPWANDRYS
jgi:DMSO/TMAO reductase YedYZ molybdopterin-dependent catalytic subunit